MYSKHRLQLERLYAEHAKEERTIKELYKKILRLKSESCRQLIERQIDMQAAKIIQIEKKYSLLLGQIGKKRINNFRAESPCE